MNKTKGTDQQNGCHLTSCTEKIHYFITIIIIIIIIINKIYHDSQDTDTICSLYNLKSCVILYRVPEPTQLYLFLSSYELDDYEKTVVPYHH